MAVAVTFFATAQDITFGPKVGINLSNYRLDFAESDNEFDTDARLSYVVGGFVDIGLSDQFSIRPELLLSAKGGEIVGTVSFIEDSITISTNRRVMYLEVPVYATYKAILGSTKFLINAGPYMAFGLRGKSEIETSIDGVSPETVDIEFTNEIAENSNDDIDFIRGFDFGINGGLGVILSDKFMINATYSLGLTNITPEEAGSDFDPADQGLFNSAVRFSVGYVIGN